MDRDFDDLTPEDIARAQELEEKGKALVTMIIDEWDYEPAAAMTILAVAVAATLSCATSNKETARDVYNDFTVCIEKMVPVYWEIVKDAKAEVIQEELWEKLGIDPSKMPRLQ